MVDILKYDITKDDMKLLSDNLSPNGLLIQTIVSNPSEVEDFFTAACGYWE